MRGIDVQLRNSAVKRIYAKARRYVANRDIRVILSMLDEIGGEEFQDVKGKIVARLEEMIARDRYAVSMSAKKPGKGWDFRREKAGPGIF